MNSLRMRDSSRLGDSKEKNPNSPTSEGSNSVVRHQKISDSTTSSTNYSKTTKPATTISSSSPPGSKFLGYLSDALQIATSLILISCLLSYFITSSFTWGYETRLTNPGYLKFRILHRHPVELTDAQLSLYDGSNPSLPIYLGVGGKVYDVTAGRRFYGPGGNYHFMAGRDAARVFVTGCFNKPDEYTHDLRGLDQEFASKEIEKWQNFYENHPKYWLVGTVEHEPVEGEPPSPCQGLMKPGGG